MNLANIHTWPHQMQQGAVGKLPNQPDFIRAGPAMPEVQVYDRWVEASLAHAMRGMGGRFDEAYDSHLYYRLVFRPQEGQNSLVGVLRAAQDLRGRRYPISMFGAVPRSMLDSDPLSVLSITDSLFPHFEANIQAAAGLTRLDEIYALMGAPLVVPSSMPDYNERYESFLEDVTCGSMVGSETEPGEELLGHLVEVVSSHRRRPQSMPQGILLPLNQPPFARTLEIQFWLELMMILLHLYPLEMSWMWKTGDDPPMQSSLVLCTRQPTAKMFRSLLDPAQPLWKPWLDSPFAGAAVTERVTVKLHRDHTLRELLAYLCPGYPDVCPWRQGRP